MKKETDIRNQLPKWLCILVILVWSSGSNSPLHAQTIPDLYSNDTEEALFRAIKKGDRPDTMMLFLAIDREKQDAGIITEINEYTRTLQEKVAKKKTLEKKLTFIDKRVLKDLFQRYDEEVNFSAIFESGKYNCVSATALFAIILERNGIAYEITEKPEGVFITADPDHTAYFFESVVPAQSYLEYDAKYQEDFVDYLHRNKIISEDEFKNTARNTLFKEYYSKNRSINLVQLAGVQYYNQGVFEYNSKAFRDAMNSFIKAKKMYDSHTITYMLNIALTGVMDEEMDEKAFTPELLQLYFSLNKNDEEAVSKGVKYFHDLTIRWLIDLDKTSQYHEYCENLLTGIQDSIVTEKLLDQKYYLEGYYQYTKERIPLSLELLGKAYELNPGNEDTRKLSRDLVVNHVLKLKEERVMLDTIEKYTALFPFLNKDPQLGDIRVQCLAHIINDQFESGSIEEGLATMENLEFYHRFYPGVKFDQENVVIAYAQASSKLVRDRKYDQAATMLQNGLKLVPGSPELERRLKNIERFTASLEESTSTRSLRYYNAALEKVQTSNREIAEKFYEYGFQKWRSLSVNGSQNSDEIDMLENFSFYPKLNRRANVELYKVNLRGSWSFNESNCTLTITYDQGGGRVSLMITDISESRMSGIIFFDGDHANAYRVYLGS